MLRKRSRSRLTRLRLRRRLVLYSLPVALAALLVAAKMISVVMVGGWTVSDFESHDIDALSADISMLRFVDVIDPARTDFAEGDLMVLDGRLTDAETQFVDTLSRFPDAQSCPVRANLLLVRETLGDLATTRGDRDDARGRYNSALEILNGAPAGCFSGSADPNEDRRAILDGSQERLQRKLDNLDKPPRQSDSTSAPTPTPQDPPEETVTVGPSQTPVPPPAPEPEPGPQDPSLPQETERPVEGDGEGAGDGSSFTDIDPDRLPTSGDSPAPLHQLHPGVGDPIDTLRTALDNSNAYGDNRE